MKRREHRRIVLGLVMLIMVAILIAGSVLACAGPAPVVSEWNIPQITILTGFGAMFGLEAEWGASLAMNQVNEAGGIGGVPIKLTPYDTAFDPAKAVTVMTQVLGTNPLVILGPMDQTGAEASGDLAATEGVPFISSLPSPMVREQFAPWGVSYFPDIGDAYARGVAEWLRLNPDIKSVVLFYSPTFASHVEEIEYVEEELDRLGIEMLGKVEVTFGQVDLSPVATRALSLQPDGYYSVLNAMDQGNLARELYNLGVTDGRRIACGAGASGMSFYELGEGFLEDTYIWDFYRMDYEGTAWQDLVEAYRADHDGALPYSTAIPGHYEAIYAIQAAFETLEITGDPDKLAEERIMIRDFLWNATGLVGLQGDYDYTNGKKLMPIYVFQIQNNVPQLVSTLPPE